MKLRSGAPGPEELRRNFIYSAQLRQIHDKILNFFVIGAELSTVLFLSIENTGKGSVIAKCGTYDREPMANMSGTADPKVLDAAAESSLSAVKEVSESSPGLRSRDGLHFLAKLALEPTPVGSFVYKLAMIVHRKSVLECSFERPKSKDPLFLDAVGMHMFKHDGSRYRSTPRIETSVFC